MTLFSIPTALLLTLVAVIALIVSYLAPPKQVRGVMFVALALAVFAVVIDLVVALR